MPDASGARTDTMPVVRPMDAALGAEISNIDLSKPLSDEQFAVVERAFVEHKVLVFRSQPLTDEQQLGFAKRFGELEGHINRPTRHAKHDKVQVFSNVKADGTTLGRHPSRPAGDLDDLRTRRNPRR